jgi:hypothetical protein
VAGALTDHPTAEPGARAVDALWRFLRRPTVAVVLALLLLALLLLARLIPQIPGQAAEDPASAVRWLNAERDSWGVWGGFLRAAGFFNVMGSPLFYLLVALLTLVCGVHLAAQVAAARLPRQLQAALDLPFGLSPLLPAATERIAQVRLPLPAPLDASTARLHALIANAVGTVTERRLAAPPEENERGAVEERRLLAMVNMRALQVRPLLPAGALLALGVLWFTALFGWNVHPPTLAPGETYTAANHGVTFAYRLPAEGNGLLDVTIEDEQTMLPAGAAQARVGSASVRVQGGVPALLLRVDAPLLALPGAPETRAEAGLIFPQPGSEQIVLLPESGTGVRLVRLPQGVGSAFLVEVYARDGVQPVQRLEMTEAQSVTLPLESGDVALWIQPAQGLNVLVRSAPGGWLLWPALALVIAGLASLWWKPIFALAQLQPWPVDRTVLTLQTNHIGLASPQGLLDDHREETKQL